MADIGEPDCEEGEKKLVVPVLLFPADRLNLDKVRAGFTLIVDAISDIDLFGGFGVGGTLSAGFGTLPLFGPIAWAKAASTSLDDAVGDLGRALSPVGSSRPCTPLS
jgi:hypothetical protein